MKKRFISVFITILMVGTMLPVTVFGSFIVDSGYCGGETTAAYDSTSYSYKNLTWVLDSEGVMTISGTGKMRNYYFGHMSAWHSRARSVIIGRAVTNIGDYAFFSCEVLTSVTIPDSVTKINLGAFFDCENLQSVIIPSSVTVIDNFAFSGCKNLTNVYYTGTQAQWNRISIGSSNSNLTGAAIHYNSSPLEKQAATPVPNGKYRITVLDPDGTPVEDAKVTWKDDKVNLTSQTGNDGSVLFDLLTYGSLQITVSKDGYLTWSNVGSVWRKSSDKQDDIILYPSTMSPLKIAVARYANSDKSNEQDILAHTKSISLGNNAYATGDLDFGNFYLWCTALETSSVKSYALFQREKQIATSNTGDFGKISSSAFVSGGNCFIRVTGKDGTIIDTPVNLIFSKSSINDIHEISLNGESISIAVGDDVPYFGGGKIDFDLPIKFPITVCATDESLAIGFNADVEKSKADLRKTINDIKEAGNTGLNKQTKNNLKALMKENNKAEFFKGVDMSVIGYAEADWGSSTATGEIAFVITTKAVDVEYNTVVVFVPVTVQVGVSLCGTAVGKITYNWEKATLSGDVTLASSVGVEALGAVGISDLIGAGAYGSATLDILLRILGTPAGLRSVDLTGELGVKAYVGALTYKKPFAYNTWHLYTANSTKAMPMLSSGVPMQAQMYEAAEYQPHDLSYMVQETAWLGEATAPMKLMAARGSAAKTTLTSLLENTYRNAQPVAIVADGEAYAAFLRADEDGNIYTVVTKYDGTSWKTPVRTDDASLLDNSPQLCVDENGTVWLTYTQTDAGADKTSLTSYASLQKLVVGTVDADTLVFTKVAEYTGDYIHMPELTVVDGAPVLVWAESEVQTDNDVLMPLTSSIYTAVYGGGAWQEKQLMDEVSLPLYELCPSDGTDALRVACLVDSDGDITTLDDIELREGGSVIAENASSVDFAKLPGESNPGYLWVKDGCLCSESGTVLSGIKHEYSVTEDGVFFSDSDADLAVYKYVNGTWSNAITLTEGERYLEDLTALDTTYGEIILGMNTKATITEDDVIDEKDLVWSKITAVNDLRLDYVSFDDVGIAVGEDLEITVGVTNAGDHEVSGISLTLNDVKTPVVCPSIAPGETAEITFAVTYPTTFSEYTVEVNEDGATDYNAEDNAQSFYLGCSDLIVSASCVALGNCRQVEAIVNNAGIAPAGGVLTLFNENGEAISDSYISNLAAGDSAVVIFSIDAEDTSGLYTLQIVSDDETEKSHNNTAIAFVPKLEDLNGNEDANVVCDLNGDEIVDSADLTTLARHIAKIELITDTDKLKLADVNGDKLVNAADLTALAQYI